MSATNEAALAAIQDAVFGKLKKNWGWLLALGIVCIALGTVGLYLMFAFTLATVWAFGMLILAAGIFQLINTYLCKGWKSVL